MVKSPMLTAQSYGLLLNSPQCGTDGGLCAPKLAGVMGEKHLT